MYKKHYSFCTPDLSTPIWRYLDLWKFLDILDNKKLHLPRADKFEDTFEGRIPKREIRQLDDKNELARLDHFSERALKKSFYVSSWSMEENETYPLWKVYSDYRTAIAIKSTVGCLIDSLKGEPREQFIGKVRYVDPKASYSFEGNTFQLFLDKRKYFAFENEVRMITVVNYKNNDELLQLPDGIRLNIDIDTLIQEIYLAPKADESFRTLIELKIKSIGLDKRINFSDI